MRPDRHLSKPPSFLLTPETLSEQQRYGNQLHVILSYVNFEDEIDSCVESLYKEGQIEHEFVVRLKADIKNIFKEEEYQKLFENSTEILSEQAIISGEFATIRPDKIIVKEIQDRKAHDLKTIGKTQKAIVIDYKTGMPKNKDIKQITQYTSTLKELGYTEVEGYIFYTSTQKLERIN